MFGEGMDGAGPRLFLCLEFVRGDFFVSCLRWRGTHEGRPYGVKENTNRAASHLYSNQKERLRFGLDVLFCFFEDL